jgi:hypothetical protein
MGDARNRDLRLGFERRLKVKFLGRKVATEAGLLAHRELDETLGLIEMAQDSLQVSRRKKFSDALNTKAKCSVL